MPALRDPADESASHALALSVLVERLRHLEGEVDFLRTEQIRLSRRLHAERAPVWWRLLAWLSRGGR